jgi:hypothetical protein
MERIPTMKAGNLSEGTTMAAAITSVIPMPAI